MIKIEDDEIFEWNNGKFPGVFIKSSDDLDMLVHKAKFAYEKRVPIYICDWDIKKSREQHKIINFWTNIGYVIMFLDSVNGTSTYRDMFAMRLIDHVDYHNMNRYDIWSPLMAEYLESLTPSEKKKWIAKPPEDYEFEEPWVSMHYTLELVAQ